MELCTVLFTCWSDSRYENLFREKLQLHMAVHQYSIFMHDSVPCHRSKAVQSFLNQQRINMLEWPGNSRDLNLKTNFLKSIPLPCVAIKTLLLYFIVFLEKGYHFCRSPTALKAPDRSKPCRCLQFAECNAGLLYY